MVIAAFYPLSLVAGGICSVNEAAARLDSLGRFAADVNYAVSLPQNEDDVVYTLKITSAANSTDTLCEARYLIDWSLPAQQGESRGFQAYFPGHHYRYRDHRLQEYHFTWDSIPFLTGRGGVQRNGQFVDLLPQMLAREIRAMAADSTFYVRFRPDSVVSGQKVAVIRGAQKIQGYDGNLFTMIFDPVSYRPLKIYREYNPGSIAEQSVTVTYSYPDGQGVDVPSSEEALMALYPEVFEKYRQSNYRVENLRGLPIPGFALPTLTGERYTHHKGEPFAAPTVIALLDPSVATTAETVAALRKAVDTCPGQTGLILAFTSTNTDTIEEITGPLREGEAILISARPLTRDCGVNDFPTTIITGRDGVIKDVILGFNRNITENVIQSASL